MGGCVGGWPAPPGGGGASEGPAGSSPSGLLPAAHQQRAHSRGEEGVRVPLAGLHAGAEALQGAVHAGGAHAPAHGREAAQVHGECPLALTLPPPWAFCPSQSLRPRACLSPRTRFSLRACAAVGVCQRLCGYVRVAATLPAQLHPTVPMSSRVWVTHAGAGWAAPAACALHRESFTGGSRLEP